MYKNLSNSLNSNLTYRSVSSNTSKPKPSYEELTRIADQNYIFVKENNERETRIPWRAICLALFLVIVGSVIILISILILSGFILSIRPNDGILVLVFLGFLMFIPGFYHIRIAYYAYYQCEGYAFDDIPDFD